MALALEHELTLVAAEVYQRLGTAREISGDYAGAFDALETAVGFCETDGGDDMEYTCLSCMAYVLRELGDWPEAGKLCDRLLDPGASLDDTLVADGVLGSIRAFRGDATGARPLLTRCLATATRLDVVSMSVDSAAALAWLDELEGDIDRARGHCRFLLERWERSEDHHYAVWGLRWAACFLALHGDLTGRPRLRPGALEHRRRHRASRRRGGARARARRDGARRRPPRRRRGAAHARGRLHETLRIPFERAQIKLERAPRWRRRRRRDAALEQLKAAYGRARQLGRRRLRRASPSRSQRSGSRSRSPWVAGRPPSTTTAGCPSASSR